MILCRYLVLTELDLVLTKSDSRKEKQLQNQLSKKSPSLFFSFNILWTKLFENIQLFKYWKSTISVTISCALKRSKYWDPNHRIKT